MSATWQSHLLSSPFPTLQDKIDSLYREVVPMYRERILHFTKNQKVQPGLNVAPRYRSKPGMRRASTAGPVAS